MPEVDGTHVEPPVGVDVDERPLHVEERILRVRISIVVLGFISRTRVAQLGTLLIESALIVVWVHEAGIDLRVGGRSLCIFIFRLFQLYNE